MALVLKYSVLILILIHLTFEIWAKESCKPETTLEIDTTFVKSSKYVQKAKQVKTWCDEPGLCLGGMLEMLEVNDVNDCSLNCKETNGCKWFSFDSKQNLCYLNKGCIKVVLQDKQYIHHYKRDCQMTSTTTVSTTTESVIEPTIAPLNFTTTTHQPLQSCKYTFIKLKWYLQSSSLGFEF